MESEEMLAISKPKKHKKFTPSEIDLKVKSYRIKCYKHKSDIWISKSYIQYLQNAWPLLFKLSNNENQEKDSKSHTGKDKLDE